MQFATAGEASHEYAYPLRMGYFLIFLLSFKKRTLKRGRRGEKHEKNFKRLGLSDRCTIDTR